MPRRAKKSKSLPKLTERVIPRRSLNPDCAVHVYGQYHPDDDVVELDPRQSSLERLDSIIHESVHREYSNLLSDIVGEVIDDPKQQEELENQLATQIAFVASRLAWSDGYRRIQE